MALPQFEGEVFKKNWNKKSGVEVYNCSLCCYVYVYECRRTILGQGYERVRHLLFNFQGGRVHAG